MDLYQVCSVGDPRVQNGPEVGGLGFENEISLKIFLRTARRRCLKFGMIVALASTRNPLPSLFR